jgi:hypothetical protein
MLFPAIDNPAGCEIRAVILFLRAKKKNAAEIHCELCSVYGQNVMSEGTVRQWCGMFIDGRTIVHDEERSGRPSEVSDDFVKMVDQQKIGERRRFIISEVSCEFSQMSCSVLYDIIIIRLAYYHKFCARWVPKMLMVKHKTQRMASALTFLGQ